MGELVRVVQKKGRRYAGLTFCCAFHLDAHVASKKAEIERTFLDDRESYLEHFRLE